MLIVLHPHVTMSYGALDECVCVCVGGGGGGYHLSIPIFIHISVAYLFPCHMSKLGNSPVAYQQPF